MGHQASAAALLVIAAALALILPLDAVQPWRLCDRRAGNYSGGSNFATNLQSLISTLSADASTSPALFASGSSPPGAGGGGADTVYGLLLCRGDLMAQHCSACAAAAAKDVARVCNHTRDAALLYDDCYVRVSGDDFLSSTNNSGEVRVTSPHAIPASINGGGYVAAVRRLLNATARYAVDHAAAASSSPGRMLYFATGQLVGLDTQVPSIWSMVQCAGDLSPEQCRKCLDDLVAEWWVGGWTTSSSMPTGKRIAGSRCNLRSELLEFCTGRPMVKLQMNAEAPAPSMDAVPGGSGSNHHMVIVVVTVGTIVVLLVLMVVAWCVRGRRQARQRSGSITLGGMRVQIDQVLEYTYDELKKATGNFSKDAELGRGAFGVVYKATLENKKVIAVKKLQRKEKVDEKQFRNEVTILSGLKHKNLVKLDGYCVHQKQEGLLCYEYLPDGNLEDRLIHGRREDKLTWEERLHILEGICKGLQYLHNESPNDIAIMHMDLKTDNILLHVQQDKKNGGVVVTPKISDFGISRHLGTDMQHEYVTEIVGNWSCMPPEFMEKGKASPKVDIYSFGLIILEIVTGKSRMSSSSSSEGKQNRYGEGLIKEVREHWEKKDIEKIKDPSMDTKRDNEIEKCIKMALDCVLEDPEKRPDIATISRRLNDADAASTPCHESRPDQINMVVEYNSAATKNA
ncbi:unnamed protein product [Urochloa decumbens]|uniref:Uncharacterized protein n=1 Tax=Urochloa decumbens TaxID=240449 RepID=A0ABC9BFH1_9POAL